MVTDTKVKRSLPQGVGKFTRGWIVFTVVSLTVLIAGIAAYLYESSEGMAVTGMRNIGSQGVPRGVSMW